MYLKLLLLTSIFSVAVSLITTEENDFILAARDLIYYIHRDHIIEKSWNVSRVLPTALEAIGSINSNTISYKDENSLISKFRNIFLATKALSGDLTKIHRAITYMLDPFYPLYQDVLPEDIVGIIVAYLINAMNSLNAFENISGYLIEVYQSKIVEISSLTLKLLQNI